MDPSMGPAADTQLYQNVVVMRHGDRIDNFEPLWAATAARPWDPPLVEAGKVRAFCTGRKLRSQLGFPIDRVFVSPFLRCVQTAAEVVSALCAGDDDLDPNQLTSDGLKIDPSKLKICRAIPRVCWDKWIKGECQPVHVNDVSYNTNEVSIEYGLCEMLNREAIRPNVAPKDGKFSFNISELEAMLPAGTVDHSVQKVYEELPRWEETVSGARSRYAQIIKALADKFPSENLLLVTHGEGVGVSFSAFLKDITVYEVEYCAYSHSRRPISFDDNKSFTAGDFEVSIPKGQTGIRYYPLRTTSDDAFSQPDII